MTDTHDTHQGGVERRDDRVDQSSQASSRQSEYSSAPLNASDSGALKEMLTIAIPSVATMTSYTIMAFVDKLMVKDIGEDPVYISAQSNGSMLVWMLMAYVLGMNGVINSFVSQNYGANKPERGAAYTWNGLWIGAFFYITIMIPMIFVIPSIYTRIHDGNQQLIDLESQYAAIMLLGGFFVISARSIHHYFYGLHRPNVVLVSALVGNVTNIILNILFIFGDAGMPIADNWFGQAVVSPVSSSIAWIASLLGISAMGIKGAAIATAIGGAMEFFIPFGLFVSAKYARLFGTREAWRVSLKCLKDLFRVGFAPGMMFANEMICWTILMMWLVPMGGEAVGDDPVLHNTVGWIALQYMHLSFMPAVGISIATQAMVGKAMGRGRPDIAVSRTMLALKITVGYMGLCALCFVLFREQLVDVFINEGTSDAERTRLLEIGVIIMIAAAVFQIFDAFAITMTGALRGAGDTVWPGVLTIILSWVCIPGVGLALIKLAPDLGSIGPWIGASLYIILLGILLGYRFKGGKWKSISLVDRDENVPKSIDLDPFDDVMPDPTIGAV
ncbi:MAG: MATE family efflux transporter [Phycisphaerales bacterium]|nr:MATE family efflux transporter [Phycisphaerales bacterium]